MNLTELSIADAWVLEPEKLHDERGFFARIFCDEEFLNSKGLQFRQHSISFNERKGTLRGMHFQKEPYAEEKLVRVTRGKVFDVLLDLREESSSFCKWCAIELSEENRKSVFIPKGVAHGFQTLADKTEVFYQMTTPYHPEASSGVLWNDPAFDIKWPDPVEAIISDKDNNWDIW